MQEIDKLYYELNNNKHNNLMDNYFNLQEFYQNKYGNNTILFMEIGSFYEIYEDEKIGKAKIVADILNIQLTRKNKKILEVNRKNPYLAGIPSNNIDKYINVLIRTKEWNIVIVSQKKENDGTIIRYFDKILSPGINETYVKEDIDNFITSIYIEKTIKDIYLVGLTSVDVSTGKSYIKNVEGTLEDKEIAIDEINNFLSSHNSNEIIIQFEGINNQSEILNKINLINKHYLVLKNRKNKTISYKNKLFSELFKIESFLTPIEDMNLERRIYSIESLLNICEFIVEHDIKLAKGLKKPIIIEDENYLKIGNNALIQLNIVNNSHVEGKSVFDIIDYTSTSMGKRLLKERLTKPILNKEEITSRYRIVNLFKNNLNIIDIIKKYLIDTYDIERLLRKIIINSIQPYELSYLYDSLSNINNLINYFISDFQEFINIYKKNDLNDFYTKINLILKSIEDNFNLNELYKYKSNQITGNFLNLSKYTDLAILIEELEQIDSNLNEEKNILLGFSKNLKIEDIKIKYTELEGYFIEVSRNKYEKELKKTINNFDYSFKILKSNVKIWNTNINKISDKKVINLQKIINYNIKYFNNFILDFRNENSKYIEKIINMISEIDVYNSSAILMIRRQYILPEIVNTEDSFLEFKGLRHSIIETIEENGIYIPNDLSLGKKDNAVNKNNLLFEEKNNTTGILLYGINSSGKSSFNKSIGIATILAQAGIPVPATTFRYSIFNKLYTRITGNDDIYKGLSTFAVEMQELKNILNRCDNKSLILGDEISHGTETISGLSIVASAIKMLSKKNNIFLFSTHLHQLKNIDIIQKIDNLQHLHLSVYYDEKSNKLIYDRKLKLGNGSSIYGLEFAKSLNMNNEFLTLADNIRRELSNDLEEAELIVKNKKKVKYNKNVSLDICSICSAPAEDIHHIHEQHRANDNGMINHFHKNHSMNLIPLCKKHHKCVHKYIDNCNEKKIENIIRYIKTSSGFKLWLEPELIKYLDISIDNNNIISY